MTEWICYFASNDGLGVSQGGGRCKRCRRDIGKNDRSGTKYLLKSAVGGAAPPPVVVHTMTN